MPAVYSLKNVARVRERADLPSFAAGHCPAARRACQEGKCVYDYVGSAVSMARQRCGRYLECVYDVEMLAAL